METLQKFQKTQNDVLLALQKKEDFQDDVVSRPVSLTEALNGDMAALAEGKGKIGWPATAWWWFTDDLFRPLGTRDMLSLMPRDEEMHPLVDPVFRMPVVGIPDGRRSLTEYWESLGYETLRKERRSGRLAEKKAFSAGFDVPSAPSDDWLGLPKDYLRGKVCATEICKAPDLVEKMNALLHDLRPSPDEMRAEEYYEDDIPELARFNHMHPLTEMLLDEDKEAFSKHCLSIGPDDEVAAEILKLQEMLLRQMVTNRKVARRFAKAALRSNKTERKRAARRERLEKEIAKCQRTIETHEKKKQEAAAKAQEKALLENPGSNNDPDKLHPVNPLSPLPLPLSLPLHPSAQSLLLTPNPLTPKEGAVSPPRTTTGVCDVCGVMEDLTSLATCSHCGIHVHPACYGPAGGVRDGPWWCLPCRIYHERQRDLLIQNTGVKSGGAYSVECKACPNRGGAFQRTADSRKWIHTICNVAFMDALRKGMPAIGKCSACGKMKGKVFRCHTEGCKHVVHATCAKARGKLSIKTQKNEEETFQEVELNLCAPCSRGEFPIELPDLAPQPCIADMKDEEVVSTAASRKRKTVPRAETSPLPVAEIISDEDNAANLVANRTRAKRQKKDPERHPRKRGRPKNSSNTRKESPANTSDKEATFNYTLSSENRSNRRLTRSMK